MRRILRTLGLGPRGERRAARFLRRRGLRILHRGYVNAFGEIDLVCRGPNGMVVFVEVKTRRRGEPWQAVDLRKQRQISRVAARYLRDLEPPPLVRFDVVSIVWPPGRLSRPQVEHFIDAFVPEGRWMV